MSAGRSRKWRRRLGLGLLLPAGAAIALYALVHSPWGLGWAAREVSRALSSRMDGQVDIQGLSGWFPFWVGASRIAVSGSADETAWLVVEEARMAMDLPSIRARRWGVAALTARRVVVGTPPATGSSDVDMDGVWERVPSLRVGAVHVGALDLGGIIPGALVECYGAWDHRDAAGRSRFVLRTRGSGLVAALEAEQSEAGGDWACQVAVAMEPRSVWHARVGLPEALRWRARATSLGDGSGTSGVVEGWVDGWGSIDGAYDWIRERSDGATMWSVGFDGELADLRGPIGGREYGAGLVRGRVRVRGGGGRPTRVEAVAAPTGLVGLPPAAAAVLGSAPDLAAVVSVDAGVLTIESAIVTAAVGRVEADGIVQLPDRRANLRWQGTVQPELGLPALARSPWAVPVQPVEARGDLSVTWVGQARLEGAIAMEEVLLPSARIENVDTRITFAAGDGPMPLSVGASAERIEAGRLVIERVRGWGRFGAAEQEAGIAMLGRWGTNLSAAVEGGLRRRGESVRVQINRVDVPHPVVPVRLPEPLRIAFDSGTTRVERVVVLAGPARLVGEGMTDGSSVRGRVTLEPMNLSSLPGLEAVTGTAGAALALSGSLRQPRLAGTMDLSDVGILPDGRRPDVRLQVAGEVSYADGMLRADAGIEGSHGSRYDVHAQVPVLWRLVPWTLDAPAAEAAVATARGTMNLDVLNALPLMTEQRLSGILELDLRATGHPLRPAFSGTGRVRDGRYEHFTLGTSLRNGNLSMEVDDRTLRITSLQARDQGTGRLEAHGRIPLRPGEQFAIELACELRDLHLVGNDLLSATAAGTLQLRRDPTAGMTLDGSLTLDPVDVFIPSSLPLPPARYTIVDPGRPPAPAPDADPPTRGAPINLDVRIAIPSRLFVAGRGLDSEWSGRLHLAGTATMPRITGQLQPLRGGFDFFGQPFRFRESTVRLTGEHPPRPSLDLTLERTRADLTARLKIGGTTAQPQFALESEPPMPAGELLPRLLFGRHGSEISALQAIRIAQATRTLQGKQSAFDFMGNAQQFLRVDQLDIEGANDAEGATRITAGKYLSDRVYLEGSNDIGSRGGQLSLEIELTPRISLTTDVREEMKQGVGIKFKRHF